MSSLPVRAGTPFVTFDLWRVASRRVPAALLRMAADRRPLRRVPGLGFAKLIGTGSGVTFTPRDADVHRWGLLSVWNAPERAAAFEDSPTVRGWNSIALERRRYELTPLASRGRWSRRTPFGDPAPTRWDGPVVAITRARLRPRTAVSFWRAVPPVVGELTRAPGLRYAIGIGESPVGLQGTFSVWSDARSLATFAYGSTAHTTAIRRTATEGWYAEELFARFALTAEHVLTGGPARA